MSDEYLQFYSQLFSFILSLTSVKKANKKQNLPLGLYQCNTVLINY